MSLAIIIMLSLDAEKITNLPRIFFLLPDLMLFAPPPPLRLKNTTNIKK